MAKISLLDLTKAAGHDRSVGLIESVTTVAPELGRIPGRVISGTSYKTLDRNALPATGFTNANEGIAAGKSGFAVKTVECFIFRGAVNADKALADAWDGGRGAYQALEAIGVARSAGIKLGQQVWYGTSTDGKGFPGAQSLVTAAQTYDATGSTASTGSSVYGLKLGPQFVQMIYGGNQTLALAPFREQSVFDGNGGQYAAYVSELTTWVGLQAVHPNAIGRIKNLTAQAGKTLTDAIIANWLATFPVGFTPDVLFMSRRSRLQLQLSRSVVINGDGKGGTVGSAMGNTAPVPTEAFGIPIEVTDNILDTEAIA
jgi:hypothetical protein